jgi:Domain of unknown function (DUF4124)
MNIRLTPSLLAIVLTSALALPVSAGSLYTSVDADGAILFSDMPPPSDARIVAQRATGGTIGMATAPGMPYYEFAEPNEAVARANEQVDLAEHALALARQGLWSPRDGLRLVAARMTRSDAERLAFYKKGVQIARQQLMDLLRERQVPMQLAGR